MRDEEHLTADQCEEISHFLRQDAASKPTGPEREKLLTNWRRTIARSRA